MKEAVESYALSKQLRFVVSHPLHKHKNMPRMGHRRLIDLQRADPVGKSPLTACEKLVSNVRMDKNDHAAIQAVLAGDKEAYGTLVIRHSHSLFRVAYRITGNEADAEDVVQEAFLRGYRKLEGFESRSNFGTWIYRIAVHCALDRVKHRRGDETNWAGRVGETNDPEQDQLQVADHAAGPDRILLSGEIGTMQETALRSLSATERTAFVLRHMEDQSTVEIGAALGIEPNAAKQAVFRAVQKMRRRLAPLRVTT
jgi:RNA polymerase sigma-70 factor (ECF subfamily)